MAVLNIPYTFQAGTAAKAGEVNGNFDAIETWSQGNIGTDNIGVLYARSIPLAITPANAILNISQTSNNQALYISNGGTNAAIQIAQSGLLASASALLKLDSTGLTQTTVGAAEVLVMSHTTSTIPALLIQHGPTETLRLTKIALAIGSNVTTTLNGPTVFANPSVTGPINLSGNLTVTGNETINRTSTNQFLELANTTTSKSLTVTPQTASFDLNINDTASAYKFNINGTTKAVIDNDGIDGQYLKTASIPPSAINGGVAAANRLPSPMAQSDFSVTNFTTTDQTAVAQATITTTAANKNIFVSYMPIGVPSVFSNSVANLVIALLVRGPGVLPPNGTIIATTRVNSTGALGGPFPILSGIYAATLAQTYTVYILAFNPGGSGTVTMTSFRLQAVELN